MNLLEFATLQNELDIVKYLVEEYKMDPNKIGT